MEDVTFAPARRENVWLRMMLMGPTGAGKTRGALEVATNLYGGQLPVALIDTEHGRSALYADRYAFSRADLHDHSPESWVRAAQKAAREFPGGVLILDSASHEWMGNGGVLQMADKFGDWKQVRPRHTSFVEALLGLPMHLIVCVRSKMKYAVDEYQDGDRTRQRISKLGLGPIQDDSFPYEFDVVAAIDVGTHEATFSNRCDALVDRTLPLMPGKEVADILTGWLSEGEPPAEADAARVGELVGMLTELGLEPERIEHGLAAARARTAGRLTPEYVDEQIALAADRLAKRAAKADAEKGAAKAQAAA